MGYAREKALSRTMHVVDSGVSCVYMLMLVR